MNREKAERWLKIGLFGAFLTLMGDCLIGAAKFPDGANMIEGYFAIALAMPTWRPILGGLIGFVGICLEFPALMTIYPLIREKMPRGGSFYKLSMYVYLAVGGGAVHLPCGVFMWIYKAVAEAAGREIGHDIALRYLLYFMLPAAAVFGVFFIGASVVQFIAFAKGRTPFVLIALIRRSENECWSHPDRNGCLFSHIYSNRFLCRQRRQKALSCSDP